MFSIKIIANIDKTSRKKMLFNRKGPQKITYLTPIKCQVNENIRLHFLSARLLKRFSGNVVFGGIKTNVVFFVQNHCGSNCHFYIVIRNLLFEFLFNAIKTIEYLVNEKYIFCNTLLEQKVYLYISINESFKYS